MTLLVVIIFLALVFDYINGFHDAANSIATVVSTKVLTPLQAVIWAAFFNFVAFFIFKDHAVANTISKTVQADFITLPVILSGLIAAITWNLLTWWYGIPSSSSHTLIGGFAGAAIAHAIVTVDHFVLKDVVASDKVIATVALHLPRSAHRHGELSMFITFITIVRNVWYPYRCSFWWLRSVRGSSSRICSRANWRRTWPSTTKWMWRRKPLTPTPARPPDYEAARAKLEAAKPYLTGLR
jgi:hypothetical protein